MRRKSPGPFPCRWVIRIAATGWSAPPEDYFEHYRYGQSQPLRLADGKKFESMFDVVLGSAVAKKLGYTLGDKLVLVHGIGQNSFSEHKNTPFQVSGILAATGTPVDKTLHISLEGLEAMHVGWNEGVNLSAAAVSADQFSAAGSGAREHYGGAGGPELETRHLRLPARDQ